MTTGSYGNSPTGEAHNRVSRVWSGADGKGQENGYTVTISKTAIPPSEHYLFFTSPDRWVLWDTGYYTAYDCGGALPLIADPNLLQACYSDISSKVRGHSFNAGTFLATLPSTLKQVVSTSSAVFEAYRAARKGNFSKAVRAFSRAAGQVNPVTRKPLPSASHGSRLALKRLSSYSESLSGSDISGTWLALRYGWVPLLQDIKEMMEAVESINKRRLLTFKAHRQIRRQVGVHANYPWPIIGTQRVAVKVILKEDLSLAAGLGLTDPTSVAWELLPFSFVIDWFTPIGEYLDNAATLGHLNPTTTVSSFVSSECKQTYMVIEVPRNDKKVIPNGRNFQMTFTRSAGSYTTPAPRLKPLRQAFSIGHLENAAALIHQLIGSHR